MSIAVGGVVCGPLNSVFAEHCCARRSHQNSVCDAMPQQLRERCQLRVLSTFVTVRRLGYDVGKCGPLNSVLAEHCCGRRGRQNSECVAMPQQLRERCQLRVLMTFATYAS